MKTADVTADEIDAAPLLINPKVKEVKPTTRSRLNLSLCIVLAINTLLQLVAIVTPGWNVQKTELSSSHESVYYTTVCSDTTPLENVSTTVCHTWTFLDDFSKVYNVAKDSKKPMLVGVYNLRVRYQINIQVSWFIVAGATIFQIFRYIRANETYHRLTAINAMFLICACSAMYQSLYEATVMLDVTSRQAEYLGVEVGFPYSVLLYAMAFMQTCASSVVVVKQIYDYTRHIQLALKETKVQVKTLQIQYNAEVEEFRQYRHLQSETTRLRGRIRKSEHVDRNSKKDKNRHEHYSRVKGNADRSPVYSEGDQGAGYTCIEQHGTSNLSTTTEQSDNDHGRQDSVNNSIDVSRGTSDLSDESRVSSAYSRNHHHFRYEPQNKPVQQTSQPQRKTAGTNQDQSCPMRMGEGYSSPKQNRNGHEIEVIIDTSIYDITHTIPKKCDKLNDKSLQMEELFISNTTNNKDIEAMKDNNKGPSLETLCKNISGDKRSRKGNSMRTVSAEIHAHSIGGDVIED